MATGFFATGFDLDNLAGFSMKESSQNIRMGLPSEATQNFQQSDNKFAISIVIVNVGTSAIRIPCVIDQLVPLLDEKVVR